MSLRPKILYPLFSSLNNIPGIGPRTTKLIEKITAPNLFGLCKHLPTNLLTRKRIIKLSFAEKDKFIIFSTVRNMMSINMGFDFICYNSCKERNDESFCRKQCTLE